jgi:hypothetical protein
LAAQLAAQLAAFLASQKLFCCMSANAAPVYQTNAIAN